MTWQSYPEQGFYLWLIITIVIIVSAARKDFDEGKPGQGWFKLGWILVGVVVFIIAQLGIT